LINEIKRKYNKDIPELLEYMAGIKEQVEGIEEIDDTINEKIRDLEVKKDLLLKEQ